MTSAMAKRAVAVVSGGTRSSIGLVATKVVPQITFTMTSASRARTRADPSICPRSDRVIIDAGAD